MLCIIAQPRICLMPQPAQAEENIPTKSASVGHNETIFSLINYAGNCTAFEFLRAEQNYGQLKEYCERAPGTLRPNEFVSYEVVLCMVLYDAAQRVCKVGLKERAKDINNSSAGFTCDAMIKGVPEALDKNIKQWVEFFKAKLRNISDCERECIQNKTLNPVCEYIWKANSLTYQAPVSSAISADISRIENPQVNSKGHGKTSKDKQLDSRASDLPSAAGTSLSKPNDGFQTTEQVGNKKTPTNKSTVPTDDDHVEANGTSTQSSSANDVTNNVKEQPYTKDSKEKNAFMKQSHTAGSNIQSHINKQAHGTNINVQNVMKKQELATNSSNHSAEVTPHIGSGTLLVHTEHTPEAGKYDESTGKSVSSDSKSNTALQPENKSSTGVYNSDSGTENENVGNDDSLIPTDDNVDKGQYTDVGDKTPTAIEGEDDGKNSGHQAEQSEKISLQIEAHQKEGETFSTAQFNQLGDAADSHFYAYFMTMVVICIIGYLVFHNKQKILALALEGRSRRGTRRRPNTSAYRKLDSNLEEAVTSTGSTSVTHVIY